MVTAESDTPTSGKADRDTVFRAALERHRTGRLSEAIDLYQRILATNPAFEPAWINLGVALRAEGQVSASIGCLRRGTALKPDDAGAMSNLGNALRAAGRLDEAVQCHEAARALDPETGSYIYNHALVLRDQGKFGEALRNFDKAVARGYDTAELKWDRALALLLQGDLRPGFAEYEWRWKIPDAKPRGLDKPAWNGENLSGKTLLVYAEQGFGDTIQFLRYLPLIQTQSVAPARIVFECQKPLARLIAISPAFENIDIVIRDETPLPPFDATVALLSLPHLVGTTVDIIPADIPYLTPPPESDQAPHQSGDLQIGFVWAGKPTHRNDRNRSMALQTLAPIFETPGTAFHSLQLGDQANAIAAQGFSALARDCRDQIADFADSAALLTRLDLVIGVDTAVIHLAGALGRPVWTMLPYAPDWRWQTGRTDCPWYPSMRLFRQSHPGDWHSVIAKIRHALEKMVEQRHA